MTSLTTWQHNNILKCTTIKKRLAMVVVVSALANVQTAMSVPVVPNFTQGSMTSNTETTSTVSETINSMNYNTGYEYVITGTNIEHDGATISAPSTTGNSNTLNGVTSTWTNLDLSNKPNFSITTPGADFHFVESYSRARPFKSHNNTENNNYKQRHKHNKYLLKLISICLLGSASPTFASDIGGVSATANPVANSSGSVTNQAIQVLQGPYITNTYGNGDINVKALP